MILAGNQSNQRGPLQLPTYLLGKPRWRSPATEFPSDICVISFAWSSQPLVPVLAAISLPDNMQLHELILTQILICLARALMA